MKLRIVNYRVSAAHDLISTLASINESVSISDFHAFIYDPAGLHSDNISAVAFKRRQAEIRDLIHRKGGIVVCILRSNEQIGNHHEVGAQSRSFFQPNRASSRPFVWSSPNKLKSATWICHVAELLQSSFDYLLLCVAWLSSLSARPHGRLQDLGAIHGRVACRQHLHSDGLEIGEYFRILSTGIGG